MTFHRNARPSLRGLTLPELLFVVAIAATLAAVGFKGYTRVLHRAEGTRCMEKLKGLHSALNAYVMEHQSWPQEPEDDSVDQDDTLWDWWYDQLKPFGIERADWFCPAQWRMFNKIRKKSGERPLEEHELGEDPGFKDPSYIPSQFGPGRLEPFVNRHPWLMEREDNHEDGHYIVMPNGTIHKQRSLVHINRMRSQ